VTVTVLPPTDVELEDEVEDLVDVLVAVLEVLDVVVVVLFEVVELVVEVELELVEVEEVSTVKKTIAVFLPSVAETECWPGAVLGTTKAPTKPPVASVLDWVWFDASKLIVTVVLDANPVPLTETVVPGTPCVGLMLIKGGGLANDMVAASFPSLAETR